MCGSYLLGSLRISAPRAVVRMCTLAMSLGFRSLSFTSASIAEIGVCVSASVGNAFIPHCVIRHDSPSPSVRMFSFHSGPKQCTSPSLPSITCSGPVYPFSASNAANTPLCVAMGSTVFFIMVNLPAVTAPSVARALALMPMACCICSAVRCSMRAATIGDTNAVNVA